MRVKQTVSRGTKFSERGTNRDQKGPSGAHPPYTPLYVCVVLHNPDAEHDIPWYTLDDLPKRYIGKQAAVPEQMRSQLVG